jgi:hypothetical protein
MSEDPQRPGFDRREAVVRLCAEGRRLAKDGDSTAALASYLEAWDLLPEPKESWDASTWILSAVGELLRAGGDLSSALDVLVRLRGRTAGGLPANP